MSPVTVDLFLWQNASEAAFLIIADPATHPRTAEFLQLRFEFGSAAMICWRAHDKKTATLPERISPWPPHRLGEPYMLTDLTVSPSLIKSDFPFFKIVTPPILPKKSG